MQRGLFATVIIAGDYGKPRPALIVQSDLFAALPSVVVCPMTSDVLGGESEFRIAVIPSPENGLRELSLICVDKISVVPRARIGGVIGTADGELMQRVSRSVAVFLGIV